MKATMMESSVNVVRTGLRHKLAHMSGKYFIVTSPTVVGAPIHAILSLPMRFVNHKDVL
jgi:hypothetical protein